MNEELLEIGKSAPDFSLLNQDGEEISLKDLKGKKNVVIYFYPRALTPGCTVQAGGIRDSLDEFEKLDTVVLGISTDPVKRLDKFREKKNLNFNLLSDVDHKVADKYKAWKLKSFMGKVGFGIKRVSYIMGKDGKIKHVLPKVNTKLHHLDLLTYIKENL